MIELDFTKNMLGINISGDFDDLNELSKSFSNLTNLNLDIKEKYATSTIIIETLNSNIRSALMGEKDIIFKENGIYDELCAYRNIKASDTNVYFSLNVSLVDMLYIAITGNKLLFISANNLVYSESFLSFIEDSKTFESFIIKIWSLLKTKLDNKKTEELYSLALLNDEEYEFYLLQYIDKLFIDLYNSKNKEEEIYNIINKLIKRSKEYVDLYNELLKKSFEENLPLLEASNDYLDSYPNEFEW
ncbi:MAG: hypothetical protein K6E20_04595 [Acholeplasmatales bacterium]|nr:hypothetical protein [Acholeplasmatales bacterium]